MSEEKEKPAAKPAAKLSLRPGGIALRPGGISLRPGNMGGPPGSMGRGRGRGQSSRTRTPLVRAPINKTRYTREQFVSLMDAAEKFVPSELNKIREMYEIGAPIPGGGPSSNYDPNAGQKWERGHKQPQGEASPPGVPAGPKIDKWARGKTLPKLDGAASQSSGSPAHALLISENRWKPNQGQSTKLESVKKQIKGILNKMTPQRFDKLVGQLCEITMESIDMQEAMIELVFEKSLNEPNFGELYASLCVKLHETSKQWPFIKDVYDEDSSKFYWVCDMDDGNEKLSGPHDSVDSAVDAAVNNSASIAPPVTPLGVGALEVAARRVKSNVFVKVYKGKTGFYWCGDSLDNMPPDFMKGPYTSKADAVYKATRETSFKRLLLNKCQEEFEKENIFDELEAEQAANLALSPRSRRYAEEDQEEKRIKLKHRMLGNIRFIGELYKKAMLKAGIMHECLQKLLYLEPGPDGKRLQRKEAGQPEEDDVESTCKLWMSIGKQIDGPTGDPRDKGLIEQYFAEMKLITQNTEYSSRIRFLVKDVLELRGAKWVPRREELKQTTLDQVRADAGA